MELPDLISVVRTLPAIPGTPCHDRLPHLLPFAILVPWLPFLSSISLMMRGSTIVTGENIVYEVIPKQGSAGERRELARFTAESLPIRHTRAFAFARSYLWATGHVVVVDPWNSLHYPGAHIFGYRIDGDLVCVDCGLKRLEPNRASIVTMIRAGEIQRVYTTDGEILHCHDCGQQIFSRCYAPRQRLGDDEGANREERRHDASDEEEAAQEVPVSLIIDALEAADASERAETDLAISEEERERLYQHLIDAAKRAGLSGDEPIA